MTKNITKNASTVKFIDVSVVHTIILGIRLGSKCLQELWKGSLILKKLGVRPHLNQKNVGRKRQLGFYSIVKVDEFEYEITLSSLVNYKVVVWDIPAIQFLQSPYLRYSSVL